MKSEHLKLKTAVIILNWNGRDLLEEFLPSVIKHSDSDDCRVFVADNGSTDDSVDFVKQNFPDTPLIILDKNYGFAEGYNKAINQVDSEYVVLLNSDVETTPGWVQEITSFMDYNVEVAAAQPKILSYKEREMFEYAGAAGGYIDRFGYPFCRGRILESVEKDFGQYDTVKPLFWATGAALFIRKKDYNDVGGLDGRFFAHMEEIDLCWRLNSRGRKIVCVPTSVVYHVGGASLSKSNPKKTYLNFRNNLLMLYKNLPKSQLIVTFTGRFLFDVLAFLHLLFKGELKNAKEVVRAYNDFYKMRPSYKNIRKENLRLTRAKRIPTQYKRSILLRYYTGKKTFDSVL